MRKAGYVLLLLIIAAAAVALAFVLVGDRGGSDSPDAVGLDLPGKIPENSASYGSNTIEGGALGAEESALVLGFLDNYYESLASLYARDLSVYFAPGAYFEASAVNAVIEVTVESRKMQPQDLSLLAYSYTLTVESREADGAGDVWITLREDSVVNFAEYPGVDSRLFDFKHEFLLTQTADGLRIAFYDRAETIYNIAYDSDIANSTNTAEIDAFFEDFVISLTADAQSSTDARLTALGAPAAAAPGCDAAYDRAAAVAYANEWVGRRNAEWPVYDDLGGNCNNFTSQCMLAGGIPMDYSAPGVWKWYGTTNSESYRRYGRSKSWSAVEPFYDYVATNSGYGLVALADAPYYSGELGDLVHFGRLGEYRHTAVITTVVTDSAGNTTDYLIAGNTADYVDFPASAYIYPTQRLIKIYGYNQ